MAPPRIGSLLYRVAGRQSKENAAAARAAKENAERSEALQTLRTIKAMTANQLTPNTNQKLLNTLQFIHRGPNRKLHRSAVEHVEFLKKARARGRWRAAVAVEKLKKGTVMSHKPLFDNDTSNNNEEPATTAIETRRVNKEPHKKALIEYINNVNKGRKVFNEKTARNLLNAYNSAINNKTINTVSIHRLRNKLKSEPKGPKRKNALIALASSNNKRLPRNKKAAAKLPLPSFRLSLPKFKRANPPPPSFNEAAARNALRNYLSETVKPKYNKALVNAILRLPKENLNNNTRKQLILSQQSRLRRAAGVLGRGAWAGTKLTAKGVGTLTLGAVVAAPAILAGLGYAGYMTVSQLGSVMRNPKASQAQKDAARNAAIKAGVFKPRGANNVSIPIGYVRKLGSFGNGYYRNKNAAASQLSRLRYGPEYKPSVSGVSAGTQTNTKPSGPSGPWGPVGGSWGPGGGIVFKPQITVGAARIGAQTFGGTRVGGQQMGGSRLRGGNTGSTTLKTGNTGGAQVSNSGRVSNSGTTSNAGRLAVSAPTSGGNRQLSATSEQLIRGAGGAEAVEKGIEALRNANGNVTRAKAASRLPSSTFTNIYAMGGPVAAKRLVEQRRRRRGTGTRGAPGKKKRVARKPKKYIKLTPYQFKRLTDHIKKNNLRRVLIKEITH